MKKLSCYSWAQKELMHYKWIYSAPSLRIIVMAHFFEKNMTGDVYLQMVGNWQIDSLIRNENEYIFQQGKASPN